MDTTDLCQITLKAETPFFFKKNYLICSMSNPQGADLWCIWDSPGPILSLNPLRQFPYGGQRVTPGSASRYRFFRGDFGSGLDVEVDVETAPSFLQLIDNRVFSRPGNYEFDFFVHFALFQVDAIDILSWYNGQSNCDSSNRKSSKLFQSFFISFISFISFNNFVKNY